MINKKHEEIIKPRKLFSIKDLIGKLQAHEKRVNEIQEDVSAQTLFSKQDGSRYFQGGKGYGQSKERGRFGRKGRGSLNRSSIRQYEANQLTGYTNSSNLKSKFDKSKVKCYNF